MCSFVNFEDAFKHGYKIGDVKVSFMLKSLCLCINTFKHDKSTITDENIILYKSAENQ